MCTAITLQTKDFYFGRTLDWESGYDEQITVMPRRYLDDNTYAVMGMAYVKDEMPLFYDAVNEKGVCMAGLHFTESAAYADAGMPPHWLIPYLLGRCADVEQALALMSEMKLSDEGPEGLPVARLHWLLADEKQAVVVEPTAQGLCVYDNPVGVLTNEPPFPMQLSRLREYRHLSPQTPPSTLLSGQDLPPLSRGSGTLGLPGDLTSTGRFVRAVFARNHSVCFTSPAESISQCFHILGTVEQVRGCCKVGNEQLELTRYTCCIDAKRGVYYYRTYENPSISAVEMQAEDLDGKQLITYPLQDKLKVYCQNRPHMV